MTHILDPTWQPQATLHLSPRSRGRFDPAWLGALLAFGVGCAHASGDTLYQWSTVAGQPGGSGYCDATGGEARFSGPEGVAMDSVGNVYVAESWNCTIRKVTPGGVVTTLAGLAGSPGNADGLGRTARFSNPSGAAVDNAGVVYVADSGNHTIRKVTPTGAVTTLADETGIAAWFNNPSGVAADSAGNVYVADSGNHTIRKIAPGGVVTTLAGEAGSLGSADGIGSEARFNNPSGVAVDNEGVVYVADYGNHTIRKIAPGGVVTTLARETGSVARFRHPCGVVVDRTGNLYVAATYDHTICKITPGGVVTTLAGQRGSSGSANGTGAAAQFYYPKGVAVDTGGNVYVADSGNHTIRKISSGGVVTTLAGLAGYGSVDGTGIAARFNWPHGVAVDSAGNAYVADSMNHMIRKITPSGVVTALAGSYGSADGRGSAAGFKYPLGVAVDSAGNVYVADTDNYTIRKITPDGMVTTLAGQAGSSGNADETSSEARFGSPHGLAVDSARNVYVADAGNQTIRRITPGGVVTTVAGLAGSYGSEDGTGSAARFNNPAGVAVDSAGTLYVADFDNHAIRKIAPGGVVTTIAHETGSVALFRYPSGVVVDSTGNLYVATTYNHTICRITPGGVVTTEGGDAREATTLDGIALAARFNSPYGIAIDVRSQLWIADPAENVIRLGTPHESAAPFISQQPQSRSVYSDESVILSVAATGAPAPQYQWRFNGTDVVWATNDNLVLVSVTTNQAGVYSVVVSNTVGVVVSSNAVLTVSPAPPSITAEPQSQTAYEGGSAAFLVTAVGSLPLLYQWRFDGADIASATNAELSLASLTASQAGTYSVVVSNRAGVVVSSNAQLTMSRFVVTSAARSGPGSLSQTLVETPPGETIIFAVTGTIPGGFAINKALTINGPGATRLAICGGSPVFLVATGVNFTLSGVTVADGQAQAGAGLYNDHGRVLVLECAFSNNIASGPAGARGDDCYGGCIWTPQGLECGGCMSETGGGGAIGGTAWGGALYNDGSLTLSNCLVIANRALGGPGGRGGNGSMYAGPGGTGGSGAGGGVCNLGSLALFNTSFVENAARGGGGGAPGGGMTSPNGVYAGQGGSAFGGAIWNLGSLSGCNATLCGNRSTGGPGYSTNDWSSGRVFWAPNGIGAGGALGNTNAVGLTNCTFSRNLADVGGAIGSWSGPVVCVNTILANSPVGGNVWGYITDGGHNLCSDDSCGFAALSSRNSTDPALSLLGHYGGATPTLALLECSPAMDAGDGLSSPTADQRGRPRPAGSGVDIGAFEGSVPGCLRITSPLVDQTTSIGLPVRMTVVVEGTPPMSYQWQFNGADLWGATDSSLSLKSAETNQSGYYAVLVSNPAGLAISAARLVVSDLPPAGALSVIPTSVSWSQGQLRFAAQGEAGRVLEVQTTTNLISASWTTIATLTNLTGTVACDPAAPNPGQRFFRLHQLP